MLTMRKIVIPRRVLLLLLLLVVVVVVADCVHSALKLKPSSSFDSGALRKLL